MWWVLFNNVTISLKGIGSEKAWCCFKAKINPAFLNLNSLMSLNHSVLSGVSAYLSLHHLQHRRLWVYYIPTAKQPSTTELPVAPRSMLPTTLGGIRGSGGKLGMRLPPLRKTWGCPSPCCVWNSSPWKEALPPLGFLLSLVKSDWKNKANQSS